MQIDITLDDDVPLPSVMIHICDRSPRSFDMMRKFRADCGTKLVVNLTQNGKIRNIEVESGCAYPCEKCKDRINKIKELIASGR